MIERRDAGNRRDHRRVGAELLKGGEGTHPELACGAADTLQIRAPSQHGDVTLRNRLTLLNVQIGAACNEQLRRWRSRAVAIPRPGSRLRRGARGAQALQPLGNADEVLRQCPGGGQGGYAAAAPVCLQPTAEVALQGGRAVLERAVPGAAAQVPAQGVLDVVEGEALGVVQQQAVQRHHDAGGAEPALGAAELHDRLLHRIEAGLVAALDGDHVLAVHLGQRHQAGGDRLVADGIPFQLADQDRAGAAVPLLAALLGAGQPLAGAQKVEHQQARGSVGLHLPVVEDEADARRHRVRRRGYVGAGSARRR